VAGREEKYLGIYVTGQTRGPDPTHKLLEDRFWDKFAGWKLPLLSHPGRLTLLKSVLTSVPIYYMSVSSLPQRTITKLTSLMHKFLWGKLDKDSYMSLVGWDKVCRGRLEGGLEIRDLKLCWQVAQESEKPWVQVMSDKYCDKGKFWTGELRVGSSALWKKICDLHSELQQDDMWAIGNGQRIKIAAQP
jgi:hypothetical protein